MFYHFLHLKRFRPILIINFFHFVQQFPVDSVNRLTCFCFVSHHQFFTISAKLTSGLAVWTPGYYFYVIVFVGFDDESYHSCSRSFAHLFISCAKAACMTRDGLILWFGYVLLYSRRSAFKSSPIVTVFFIVILLPPCYVLILLCRYK